MEVAVGKASQKIAPYTFDEFLSDIKPGFSFARYGNGEWDLILGLNYRTGSRTQYFSDGLRQAMRDTLLCHSGATLGMQISFLTKIRLIGPALNWLQKSGLEHLQWRESDVIHHASMAGRLHEFVDLIRGDIALIGPPHLSSLPFVDRHIVTPSVNAWDEYKSLLEQASGLRDCVILVSAGPTGKILVHDLHALQNGCTIIDTGSVLDPYCGKRSRRYMQNMKFEPLK